MYDDEESQDNVAEKELVAGNPSQRNWRGIGIALLVIFSICALITIAVILLTPSDRDKNLTGTKFNISELLSGRFPVDDPQPEWLSNNLMVYRDEKNSIWKVDITETESSGNLTRQKLIDGDIIKDYSSYSISPDAKYVALFSVRRKVSRRSSLKQVKIFEAQTSNYKSINDDEPVKIFEWAPNSVPPACAFVDVRNNVFYQSDAFDASTKKQITNTSSDDVYNGVSDWLYEEEIFETDSSLFFSKSGRKLAFVTINDTLVKKINMEIYITSSNYPKTLSLPYPKVGEVIPTVALTVYDIASSNSISLRPPRDVEVLKDYYLIHGTWTPQDTFVTVWSNRVQNVSFISSCVISEKFKGSVVPCKLDHKQPYENHWLSPSVAKIFLSASDRYFTILPKRQPDGFYYSHIAYLKYNANSQNRPIFVTTGHWEVIDVVGYLENEQKLFFTAAFPNASSKHLMSADMSMPPVEAPRCLTCDSSCNYVNIHMPPNDPSLFVMKCEMSTVPKSYLMSLAGNFTNIVLSNNTKYAAYLAQKLLPIVRYETVTLNDHFTANVKLLMPPAIESASVGERFPLILRVYAGPGTQLVTQKWALGFDTYMTVSRNFIVAYVDARGSSNRGSKYTSAIYRHLGTVEIDDQIAVIKYLLNTTNLIRRNAVSVWGWSYGGFATTHIIKKDAFSTFRCAAAVAPVTNFLFYDAAYTERYMGLNSTSDNYDGYQKTIVYSNVTAFGSGKFLLAHGTGDDNVHFQNSAMLVDALTKVPVQFQYMAYTNQQHSMGERLNHLYTMLDNFFVQCVNTQRHNEE